MGNKQTTFTEEQLEAYQDCTYFTRKEILRLHGRFRELAPHLVPLDYTNNPDVKVPLTLIVTMPELKENPFRERIVETFSEDGQGNLSFNDFVDMFSALCEASPRELKTIYAFKIYGGHGQNPEQADQRRADGRGGRPGVQQSHRGGRPGRRQQALLRRL
ncbi:calcium and integrin-binding family member 2 isoform X2 [Oryzias latipes]|uniref:calcium and integrin-binding family member 2 isoform X2 n=1 Tax=Oryzias latipes TaxID=8090 RepID=UPI0005CC70E7|nr:calcium and integrin-binding family member 2 isoform X2 [Oryzias latipes]